MRLLSQSAMICIGIVALAPPALAQEVTSADQPFAAIALSEATLGKIAGREDSAQISYSQQTSQVSRNSIGDNSRTGDALISDNAFQNLSGLSILNVNTGNNVAINASMNVNIAINPLP